jgi:hypothetical protein
LLSPAAFEIASAGGNWEFPCRSHYWVRRNQIHWAPQWTPQKIKQGRERDAADLERYYEGRSEVLAGTEREAPNDRRSPLGWIKRLLRV